MVSFIKLVLPIYSSSGNEVDIILRFLPYEEQAIAISVPVQHQGVSFSVCSAEDLIIQKAISEREKDWEDISGILKRREEKLDQEYIRRKGGQGPRAGDESRYKSWSAT